MIVYALRVRGIPLRWMTLIERWNPTFEFIDIQTKGPYKVLQNTHRFLEVEGGTLIAETGRVRSAIRNAGPPGPPDAGGSRSFAHFRLPGAESSGLFA